MRLKALQTDHSPAGVRSAISRGYYAAFHSAREFLQAVGIKDLQKGPGAHGEAPKLLVQTGDAAIDQAGLDLANLHSERISADYRLQEHNVENWNVGNEPVNLASEVIVTINKCLADESRMAVVGQAISKRAKELKGYKLPWPLPVNPQKPPPPPPID